MLWHAPRPLTRSGVQGHGEGALAQLLPRPQGGADHEALQEGRHLHLRQVVHHVLHLLVALRRQQDLAPEGHDGGRHHRQRHQRVVPHHAVPQQQNLVHLQVAHKGARHPGERDAQRRALDAEQVPADLGLHLLQQRLEGAAEARQRGRAGGAARGVHREGVQPAPVAAVQRAEGVVQLRRLRVQVAQRPRQQRQPREGEHRGGRVGAVPAAALAHADELRVGRHRAHGGHRGVAREGQQHAADALLKQKVVLLGRDVRLHVGGHQVVREQLPVLHLRAQRLKVADVREHGGRDAQRGGPQPGAAARRHAGARQASAGGDGALPHGAVRRLRALVLKPLEQLVVQAHLALPGVQLPEARLQLRHAGCRQRQRDGAPFQRRQLVGRRHRPPAPLLHAQPPPHTHGGTGARHSAPLIHWYTAPCMKTPSATAPPGRASQVQDASGRWKRRGVWEWAAVCEHCGGARSRWRTERQHKRDGSLGGLAAGLLDRRGRGVTASCGGCNNRGGIHL
mmetsp:Transcript_13828/g.35744  ORF Transcript_13828/g.35744 Transcript_13828/m.35744 type:complete len:509 (+) Transcript_13828:191-1717(+)